MAELCYFERQYGSLCGQHCLNNCVQAPFFQAQDLADIAAELDAAERQLMGTAGAEAEGGKGTSNNVDDAGNFSIQVLETALGRSHDLTLVQDTAALTRVLDDLNREDFDLNTTDVAFVCNLREHWFTIRSIRGQIWNLNSLKKRPQKVSLFYLSAYLGQLREEGYSIFVVEGTLPPPLTDMNMGQRSDWFVFGVDDVGAEADEDDAALKPVNIDDVADADLKIALRASMASSKSGQSQDLMQQLDPEDQQLQAALAMSMGGGAAAQAPVHVADNDDDDDDDEAEYERQLRLAMSESMK